MTDDGTMFPLVETPDYEEDCETFESLRFSFESLDETLNQVQSWFIYDEQDDGWGKWPSEDPEQRVFSLSICMPRKSKFTVWTTHDFDRSEVEAWLRGYVFDRIRRWYGMGAA